MPAVLKSKTLMSSSADTPVVMTFEEWNAEAKRRFGDNPIHWVFVCPVCGHTAKGADFKAAGANPSAMYQECIGRYTGAERKAFPMGPRHLAAGKGQGPCDYAAFGLIQLSPIRVVTDDGTTVHSFAFGESLSHEGMDDGET